MAPERTKRIGYNNQAQRRQYGLKHRVTSTIHAIMGKHVVIEISKSNTSFALWNCTQTIVTLIQIKYGENLIFVGDKNETVTTLSGLIMLQTQWTEYIEKF